MFCYCQHLSNLNTSNFLMLEISLVKLFTRNFKFNLLCRFFCLFLCLIFAKIPKVVKSKEKMEMVSYQVVDSRAGNKTASHCSIYGSLKLHLGLEAVCFRKYQLVTWGTTEP